MASEEALADEKNDSSPTTVIRHGPRDVERTLLPPTGHNGAWRRSRSDRPAVVCGEQRTLAPCDFDLESATAEPVKESR